MDTSLQMKIVRFVNKIVELTEMNVPEEAGAHSWPS